MSSTTVFQVQGMTCEHCVRSVTEEVSLVDGVTDVNVDLDSGKLEVTSNILMDVTDIRKAVEEAGYELR